MALPVIIKIMTLSLLSIHTIFASLRIIPEQVIQDCIVPFLDFNGTKAFRKTNALHQSTAKSQMQQMISPIMMMRFGDAIDAMEITIEHFMHTFLRCDYAFTRKRVSHSTIGYKLSGDRYMLRIRLQDSPEYNQALTIQLRGGRFESCLLMQNSVVHRVELPICGWILRAAYHGKWFTVPTADGIFIRLK